MNIWRVILVIFLCCDLYFNYFYTIKDRKPLFSATSYTFTGVQFIALAILLLWETQSIIKITRSMGDRLKEEVKLLRLIMWCFSLSYAFIAIFYLYELIKQMPCKGLNDCSEFTSILILMATAFFFDLVPNAALYYCHFRVTKNNFEQFRIKATEEHITSNKFDKFDKQKSAMG